jgi:hypothetical protein
MNSGAYSVFVNVDGAAGPATAIVPVNSLALKRLDMPRWMSGMFLCLGLVLFVSLAALVGTAVREGSLGIGEQVDIDRRKRGRLAVVFAVVLASGLVAVGNTWWSSVDNEFRRHRLYKPVVAKAALENSALVVRSPEHGEGKTDPTPLVPDHGKMMHLFLIEKGSGRSFAHIHPVRAGNFRAALPPLSPGAYHVYADVTHESGLTETWVSDLDVPKLPAATEGDKDDAYLIAEPTGNKVTLANGATLNWENSSAFTANAETTLRFTIRNANGSLADLQPYLGMYAHAVIWKTDGQVFTHLHPLGTISMTSQLLFARRENGESLANQPLDIVCGAPPKDVSFPYAFPEPGDYRIWVQVKIDGAIQTSVFKATVQ